MKYYIYKLCCKHENINDIYIGATKNIEKRTREHRAESHLQNRDAYHLKKYEYIRECGGFNNWELVIIEEIETNDRKQVLNKEHEYIQILKPKLNIRKIK